MKWKKGCEHTQHIQTALPTMQFSRSYYWSLLFNSAAFHLVLNLPTGIHVFINANNLPGKYQYFIFHSFCKPKCEKTNIISYIIKHTCFCGLVPHHGEMSWFFPPPNLFLISLFLETTNAYSFCSRKHHTAPVVWKYEKIGLSASLFMQFRNVLHTIYCSYSQYWVRKCRVMTGFLQILPSLSK